ncbi:MAG TPA: hypothetical protein VF746_08485 [Longimicrobium sp.]|jgi:hypothetical protein
MDRKLKLDVDTLAVSSFSTTEVDEARGTVQGQEALFVVTKAYHTYCCETRNTCTTNLC